MGATEERIIKVKTVYDMAQPVNTLKKLEEESANAEKAVKKLETQMKNAKDAVKKDELAAEFVKAKLAAEQASKAVEAHRKTLDLTKLSYTQLQNFVHKLNQELGKLVPNSEAWKKKLAEIGDASKHLNKAKEEIDKIKKGGEELADPTLWDKIKNGFASVMTSIEDLGVAGVTSLAALAVAVQAAFSYLAESFMDFEEAAADTKGELGLTEKQIRELKEEAQKTGPQFAKTAQEMLEAYNAVGSGKSELVATKRGLQDVTNAAITLSTVGKLDMKEAAEVVVESLNQYGKGAQNAAKFVDILATGTKVGASKINEISNSLTVVGPVAKSANVSFAQTNSLLQVLGQNGIKGEAAGTALRATLLELAKSTDNTINPTVVGLDKALENLANKNYSVAQMSKLVGKESVSAAIILRDNAGKVKEWTTAIEKGGGAAAMYADKTSTLKFQIAQAKAEVLNYAVSIGEKLAPIISMAIKITLSFISGIAAIPKFLMDNKVAIGGLAVALVAFNAHLIQSNAQLLYNAAVTKGKLIWDKASAVATNVMTVAQTGLNLALKANPIGLVISALVALATIIYTAYQNSQTFRAIVSGVWNVLKSLGSYLSVVFKPIIDVLVKGFNYLKFGFEGVVKIIIAALQPAVQKTTGLFGFLVNAINGVINIFKTLFKIYTEVASAIFGFIDKVTGGVMGKVVNSVKTMASSAADNFKKGFTDKIKEESKKATESLGKDSKQQVKDDDAKTKKLKNNVTELTDKQKKALEDRKKAQEEALKKIDELANEAYLEHIRRTQGEVAAEKAKLKQTADAEIVAVQKSLATADQKAKQQKLITDKLQRDLENLEEQHQKTSAEIVERWTDSEIVKKIKKAQNFANTELKIARTTIQDKEKLAAIELKINENLKDELAAIEQEKAAIAVDEADKAAKKQLDIALKRLHSEKLILDQEQKAELAVMDGMELVHRKNAQKLIQLKKERYDLELKHLLAKLELEKKAEEQKLKAEIKDQQELKVALENLNTAYGKREVEEKAKTEAAKTDLEKKASDQRQKMRQDFSNAFGALLKGDLTTFAGYLDTLVKGEKTAWMKRLDENSSKFQMIGQMAVQAANFLNDLTQKRIAKELEAVKREYDEKKILLDASLQTEASSIEAAEQQKKDLKAQYADQVKVLKDASDKAQVDAEKFYQDISLANTTTNADQETQVANQEAQAKIQAAATIHDQAIALANSQRDAAIVAAEQTRDAEITAINARADLDNAKKQELIASSIAKATEEINIANQEAQKKIEASNQEKTQALANANEKFNEQVQLANDEAEDKIRNSQRASKDAIEAANQERLETIIAAEATRDAEIEAINQRADIDTLTKEKLIEAAKSKAKLEIEMATDESAKKIKLSKDEMEKKIKDATEEKEAKIQLMEELMTADEERAKELLAAAEAEAEKKVKIAQDEKNEKLRILEQEKAKRVASKKELERQLAEEDKKAKNNEAQLKYKAAMSQWKTDQVSALVNGALATVKALASGFFPLNIVFAALTAVATGIQIAAIRKNKPVAPPSFAVGGLAPRTGIGGLPEGPRHGSEYGKSGIALVNRQTGREEGEMEGDEAIISRDQTEANLPLIQMMWKKARARDKTPVVPMRNFKPLAFVHGGLMPSLGNRQMFTFGSELKNKAAGASTEADETGNTDSSADAATNTAEAEAAHAAAQKQGEEQLKLLSEIRDGIMELRKDVQTVARTTNETTGATRAVEKAVRDTNQGSKLDGMIGLISSLGKKTAA